VENKDRGKIPAQIVDICRNRLDELSLVQFGTVAFDIRFGNVYRLRTQNDILVDKDKLPRDVLEGKTKEELVDLIIGKRKEEKGGT